MSERRLSGAARSPSDSSSLVAVKRRRTSNCDANTGAVELKTAVALEEKKEGKEEKEEKEEVTARQRMRRGQ